MKTRILIIIAVSIFVALMVFVGIIYLEIPREFIGGGSIDLDPDLSPSFAPYYYQMLRFDSIFVAGPIIIGTISLVFLVPNIILRIKKIPTRKYMLIIAACILIFFGSSYVENGIQSLLTLEQLEQENDWITLIGGLIGISMGMIFIVPGIILLKKAKLRERK